MSHEISEIDLQEGTEDAWHHKTIIKAAIDLKDCWLAKWDIVKKNMFTHNAKGHLVCDEYCKLVASDNKEIIIMGKPVHKDTFQPITNAKFLAIVSDAISRIPGAIVSSVGSVCRRTRVFVSVRIPEQAIFKAAGREFKPYLNFLNSHDQSSPFVAVISFICTVCNNTFTMNLFLVEKDLTGINAAMKRKELRIKLKHTKNVGEKLANVPDVIDAFIGTVGMFQAAMEVFGKTIISLPDAKAFFTGFLNRDLPNGLETLLLSGGKLEKEQLEAVQISTRRGNQINRLLELHEKGAGNKGETMADIFSAITDYYSHESSSIDDQERQFVSSEFGDGQTKKDEAFELLQNPEKVAHLITVGKALIGVQTED